MAKNEEINKKASHGQNEIIELNNNIYYNCNDCSSLIEILEINQVDNKIKFECINTDHEKDILIKDYLENMKQYKNNNKINDICQEHNNEYINYCFDCKNHFCRECIKIHKNKKHNTKYLYDIQPNEEELNIIKNNIIEYENIIDLLTNEKENIIDM